MAKVNKKEAGLYGVMTEDFAKKLSGVVFDLLGAYRERKEKKDGTIEESCKYHVEIPRRNGKLSRERLTVKVLGNDLVVDPEKLEDYDFSIRFMGLEVSFVNNGVVYFRAKAAEIVDEVIDL